MTEEDKNFNKWLKEYNPEQIKVFEETDLKIAYLQGCADEVEKWENVNTDLRKKLEQAKKFLEKFCSYYMYDCDATRKDYDAFEELKKQAEQFLKETDNDNTTD